MANLSAISGANFADVLRAYNAAHAAPAPTASQAPAGLAPTPAPSAGGVPQAGTPEWYSWLNNLNANQTDTGLGGNMGASSAQQGIGGSGNYGPTSQGFSGLSMGNNAMGGLGKAGATALGGLTGAPMGSVVGIGNTVNGLAAQQQSTAAIAAAMGEPAAPAKGFLGSMGDLISGIVGGTPPGSAASQIAMGMAAAQNNDPNMVSGLSGFSMTPGQVASAMSQFGTAGITGPTTTGLAQLAAAPGPSPSTDNDSVGASAAEIAAANAEAEANTSAGAAGLKKGGPTGAGTDGKVQPSRVASVKVHEGEYVLNAAATKHYGLPMLEAMNARRLPKG